tara:strand:- start:2269 stop:2649 length:381 start_codon:yes stop_codon:yes gene_type:complete
MAKDKKPGFFSKEARAARKLKRAHRKAKATSDKPVIRKKDQYKEKTVVTTGDTGKTKMKNIPKVEETGGGNFPTYKKESKSAMSFRDTFASQRKGGAKEFTWQGRKYSTRQAGEKSWNEETKKWDS